MCQWKYSAENLTMKSECSNMSRKTSSVVEYFIEYFTYFKSNILFHLFTHLGIFPYLTCNCLHKHLLFSTSFLFSVSWPDKKSTLTLSHLWDVLLPLSSLTLPLPLFISFSSQIQTKVSSREILERIRSLWIPWLLVLPCKAKEWLSPVWLVIKLKDCEYPCD